MCCGDPATADRANFPRARRANKWARRHPLPRGKFSLALLRPAAFQSRNSVQCARRHFVAGDKQMAVAWAGPTAHRADALSFAALPALAHRSALHLAGSLISLPLAEAPASIRRVDSQTWAPCCSDTHLRVQRGSRQSVPPDWISPARREGIRKAVVNRALLAVGGGARSDSDRDDRIS